MRDKKKPDISIIITSNSDVENIKQCIFSFSTLLDNDKKNFEIILVNNFESNNKHNEIKNIIKSFNRNNISLYQSNFKTNKSQLKNIGINYARGSWLFFLESYEIPTKKFVNWLLEFKFNWQVDFYRFSWIDKNYKKKKIGLFKNKYFNMSDSSLIINSEFLEKTNIKWNSYIDYGENYLFFMEIYSVKNVNYLYLKNIFSVIHNNSNEKTIDKFDLTKIEKLFSYILNFKNKSFNYKQFIIIFFYNTYLLNKKEFFSKIDEFKKMLKKANINYFSYLKLNPKLYFKTLKIKWKTLF